MEFRQLLYFVHTINEGSFTKAAEKLFISQPALSKMIKNLEKEIGSQLIHRGNNAIKLTDVGQLIFERALQITSDFEELSMYIKNISKSEEGTIILGMPSVIGTSLISSILPGFTEKYPLINLRLVEAGAKIIKEKVLADKIDVGLVILPVSEDDAKIIPLIQGGISLVIHESHRLAQKPVVTMKELENEKFLLLDDTFQLYHNVIKACQSAGFQPHVIRKSVNWDLLLELTGLKQGVTIMPTPIVKKFRSDKIATVPIDDPLLKWQIVFILRKNKIISNIEQKPIDFVIENAAF